MTVECGWYDRIGVGEDTWNVIFEAILLIGLLIELLTGLLIALLIDLLIVLLIGLLIIGKGRI